MPATQSDKKVVAKYFRVRLNLDGDGPMLFFVPGVEQYSATGFTPNLSEQTDATATGH
jgi:hypothetical protein